MIRPPTPRSKATICAVTRGNIAELAATTFVALLIVLLSVRTIGYRGEQCGGGESVCQSPLKDQAFSTFPDQNPPFELRPENGFRLLQKPVMRCYAIGGAGVCPPKAKITRLNRVGCASSSLFFSAIRAFKPRIAFCLVRVSKQSRKDCLQVPTTDNRRKSEER